MGLKVGDQVLARNPGQDRSTRRDQIPGIVRGFHPSDPTYALVGFKDNSGTSLGKDRQWVQYLGPEDKSFYFIPITSLRLLLNKTTCFCNWNRHPKFCTCKR